MSLSRRQWLRFSGLSALGLSARAEAAATEELPAPIAALQSMTDGVIPISVDERKARIARAQALMTQEGLDALVLDSGTSLVYFTGAEWGDSERFFGAVLTREGDPAWVTPAFEKERALEQVKVGSDVRAWEEDESPYDVVAAILRDRKAAAGRVGIEETMPVRVRGRDREGRARRAARQRHGRDRGLPDDQGRARAGPDAPRVRDHAAGAPRRIRLAQGRDHAARGLALVQRGPPPARDDGRGAGALRQGRRLPPRHHEAAAAARRETWSSSTAAGGSTATPATSRARPSSGRRPRSGSARIWDIVRRAQEAAFRAARPGVEAQAVDAAARKVVEEAGFGPGYRYFTHRVGHGIGMDGHEWTYLVRGNETRLRPGMCFSDEPGIYIPGELGIRHEDIITITAEGAENLTKWSGSPEEPAVM